MIFLRDPCVEKDSEFKGIDSNLFLDFTSGKREAILPQTAHWARQQL